MLAWLAVGVIGPGCAPLAVGVDDPGLGTTFEVSFPPAELPSLGTELAACPCARREGQLLLYVRIGPRKNGTPVPVSSLAFTLSSGGAEGGGDPLPVSIRQPHAPTVSNEVVPLVVGLTPAVGRVLRLEIRAGGSAGKELKCVYSGVRR